MKKTLKKAIIAITAVALVSASVAFSAFAADPAVSATYADNKITLSITGAAEGQVTVLVTDVNAQTVVAENIFYINQDASENGSLSYTFDSNLPEGEYEVRVGGAGAGTDGFLTTTFTIGNVVKPTDDPTKPTDDPTKPTDDPTKPTTPPVTDDYPVKIGDVNDDGEPNSLDALDILYYGIGDISEFTASGDGKLEKGATVKMGIADVNADGSVNSLDALDILYYGIGDIDGFARTDVDNPAVSE